MNAARPEDRARLLAPLDWIAWWRRGRPAAGRINLRPHGSWSFEEAADLGRIIAAHVGPPAELECGDLGCGASETHIGRQVLALPWKRLISVEAFEPYLEKLHDKKAAAQRHEIWAARIETALERMRTGEVDVVLLIDVLEHFGRGEALRLLERLEKIARRGVVVFLPLGDVDQEELDENPLQRHRSFWRAGDLARLGYTVEVYPKFHGQLDPPADAAWAIKLQEVH